MKMSWPHQQQQQQQCAVDVMIAGSYSDAQTHSDITTSSTTACVLCWVFLRTIYHILCFTVQRALSVQIQPAGMWVASFKLPSVLLGRLGSRVVSMQKGPGSNHSCNAVG